MINLRAAICANFLLLFVIPCGLTKAQEVRELRALANPAQAAPQVPRARIVGTRSHSSAVNASDSSNPSIAKQPVQPTQKSATANDIAKVAPRATIGQLSSTAATKVPRVRESTHRSDPSHRANTEHTTEPLSLALPDPITQPVEFDSSVPSVAATQVKMATIDPPFQSVASSHRSNESESLEASVVVPETVPPETQNALGWVDSVRAPMLQYQVRSELSLEDAIHAAIEFAPEIDILRAEVGIRSAEITKQQAVFDWGQFIQSNWDERNIPVGSTLDGAIGRSENHTLQNSLGLTKRAATGGQFKLAQDLGLADSNSQFFIPANQAKTRIGLEFSQPLLQGAGTYVATSQINIAVANAAVSEEEYMAGLQQHLITVISAYWELVRARGEFVVTKRSYERAQQTATVTANRAQLDVGPLQMARSKATVASRLNDMLRSEYAVILAQENLLKLIFGPKFKSAVNAEVIPNTPFFGPLQIVNADAEVDWSLQNRPEVRRALQIIQRTSIEEGVARNQLLPALALTMSVSNQGLAGNRAVGDSLSDQWNVDDPTYGVGLAYTFPVGNRAAKANLRQVELRVRKFCKELEQTVSTVALEVRNASHSLNLAGETREATRNALNMAEWELQTLESRTRLLVDGDQVGPLYLDNLLQSQDRLAEAERKFLNASAGYALAQFNLQYANGSLFRYQPL